MICYNYTKEPDEISIFDDKYPVVNNGIIVHFPEFWEIEEKYFDMGRYIMECMASIYRITDSTRVNPIVKYSYDKTGYSYEIELPQIDRYTNTYIRYLVAMESLCIEARKLHSIQNSVFKENSFGLQLLLDLSMCDFRLRDHIVDRSNDSDLILPNGDKTMYNVYEKTILPIIEKQKAESMLDIYTTISTHGQEISKVFHRIVDGTISEVEKIRKKYNSVIRDEQLLLDLLNREYQTIISEISEQYSQWVNDKVDEGIYTLDNRIAESNKRRINSACYKQMRDQGFKITSEGYTEYLISFLGGKREDYPIENYTPNVFWEFFSAIIEKTLLDSIMKGEDIPKELFKLPHNQASSPNDISIEAIKEKTKKSRGRRPQYLFSMENGEKNKEYTAKMAEIFNGFLKEHHSATSTYLDSKQDNYVCKSFLAFVKLNKLENSSGSACYKFLTEDCKIECQVGDKTMGDFIKRKFGQKVTLKIEISMEDYMKKHSA